MSFLKIIVRTHRPQKPQPPKRGGGIAAFFYALAGLCVLGGAYEIHDYYANGSNDNGLAFFVVLMAASLMIGNGLRK